MPGCNTYVNGTSQYPYGTWSGTGYPTGGSGSCHSFANDLVTGMHINRDEAYCKKHKLVYLDYYSAMIDDARMLRKEITEDGLHPNPAGYAIMEPLAEKAIAAALRK